MLHVVIQLEDGRHYCVPWRECLCAFFVRQFLHYRKEIAWWGISHIE
jgi:hypothetical protein